MREEMKRRLFMSMFPQLRRHPPKKLRNVFVGEGKPIVPESEKELWLQEVAIRIAKSGAQGVDFLLSHVPKADELRLRAILLAMSFVTKKLSLRQRAFLCTLARGLLGDERALVVAEAVDTLSQLACGAAPESISWLLEHPSPYVVGSALRYFARHDPEKAVPLLVGALKSGQPIVRQNAVDELDEMNYTPALAKIKRLLNDPDEYVRQAAQSAIANLENGSL
jgi:HEAT repeat protein